MNKLIIPLTLAVLVFGAFYISSTAKTENLSKPNFTNFQSTETQISTPEVINSSESNPTIFVGANLLKSSKQTIVGIFEEANNNFFEQITGYMGHDEAKNDALEVKFRPDISSSDITYGDGSTVAAWGQKCTVNNSCRELTEKCPQSNYNGQDYECKYGETNVYFDKDQTYSDMPAAGLKVKFTPLVNTTWPLGETALLGLGPQSTYLNFVLKNYDLGTDGYEFSFFYDILLKAYRFDADKIKVFDITMYNFGQNKGNLQDSGKLQTIKMDLNVPYWQLPITGVDTDGNSAAPIVSTKTQAVLVNAGNEYFALPNADMVKLKAQIKAILGCDAQCTRGNFDLDQDKFHNTYVNMKVDIGAATLTMKVPIFDLIYYKDESTKNDEVQYSIADIATWQKAGFVDPTTTMAMGRQFLINTYVTFAAMNNGDRTISIGQLSDMGKITSTERLWLMLFGCFIVLLILLALLVKLCKKKGGEKGDSYQAVQNS
jgi:hypothetical protein